LLIAAALVGPTKLLDVDAYVTGDLRFSPAPRSKCVSKAGFLKQSAMRLVFNAMEKLRPHSNCGVNPIARFSRQRFDGNVEVVT
jgi:hypothetical protein